MPRIQPKAPLQDRLMLEAMRLKDEVNELPPVCCATAASEKPARL